MMVMCCVQLFGNEVHPHNTLKLNVGPHGKRCFCGEGTKLFNDGG